MSKEHTKPSKTWQRRLIRCVLVVIGLIAVLGTLFLVYASDYYRDQDSTHRSLESQADMPVVRQEETLAFGNPDASTAFVFYPGAKIEYSAYAPLLRKIAADDILCIVVHMPFNFAFFDSDAALDVMARYPHVSTWWIGGHSLGGAMAASFVADHSDEFEGLVLLGSYPARSLSETDLSVLSMYGSNDHVLNREKLRDGRSLVPSTSQEVEIAGGNHAYFANYGEQEGDGEATISPEEQWSQTAAIISDTLRN